MQRIMAQNRTVPVHVVHVARECSGLASAGGVGDVVLQLAATSIRQGIRTTIILPHYGTFSEEAFESAVGRMRSMLRLYRHRVNLSGSCGFEVPMGYAYHPGRTESVTIRTAEFQGSTSFAVALVIADRFVGKERPYAYTAREAKAIAEADPGGGHVCGAELPPRHIEVGEDTGHFDFFAMNVLLQKAALLWLESRAEAGIAVHCHDAHTAMLPMLAKLGGAQPSCGEHRYVVTAHNCGIAYRQRCGDLEYVSAVTGLPRSAIDRCVIEGAFDPFAAAALYADHLTTVSDGYAWEVQGAWIQTSGGDADLRGFSEFLAQNSVPIQGITNGIAAELKGPEAIRSDIGKEFRSLEDFSWKPAFRRRFARRISRRELMPRWGIDATDRYGHLKGLPPNGCLFSFVGRWTYQKGVGILVRAAQEVLAQHPATGLCILGAGQQPFVFRGLLNLVDEFPGRVVVVKGFSELLAASFYAAGDYFLVPSRFEPCGLVDMIAQLNGNLPIVNQVGGLSKVIDGVTGIGYFATDDRNNLRGLVRSMRVAIDLLDDPERHTRMQRAANREIRTKYTWPSVLAHYAPLYGASVRPVRQARVTDRPSPTLKTKRSNNP